MVGSLRYDMHGRKRKTKSLSTPKKRGCSSIGRAPALHAGGSEFESRQLHHKKFRSMPIVYYDALSAFLEMMKKIITLIAALSLATTVFATREVTLLMDWFPQGNQSGYFQAQFDNQYHDDVKIIIKSGGPKINTTAQVAAGSVEFGLQASDSVMLANSKVPASAKAEATDANV